MNARTQLALMAKAKQVFETEETFLSFPVLTPLSYPEAKLRLVGPDVDLATLGEFSSLVNKVPRSVLFDAGDDEQLWDVYADLFRRGEVAESAPSPAALEAYERATAFLFETDEDGRRRDSEAYLAYKQHRDAWIGATEELRMAKHTAELGLDAEALAAWNAGLEQTLSAKVRAAETLLAGEGRRAEVEAAERAVLAFVERPSSLRLWSEWRQGFDPAIDLLTLADGRAFAPTAFTPADPFEGEWPEFTLSAAEIDRLAAEAPAELRDVLDVDGGEVERVAFQYRSVGLTRPWLAKEVFRARFWRLPEGDPPLSDGARPPAGACPAYVAAVVFARGIHEVVRRPQGGVGRTSMAALPALKLRAARATRQPAAGMTMLFAQPAAPSSATPSSAVLRRALVARVPAPRQAAVRARVVRRTEATVAPAPTADLRRAAALRRLGGSAFRVRTKAAPAADAPDPPVPPRAERIAILAFVCKRLPVCPDPDPALSWPT